MNDGRKPEDRSGDSSGQSLRSGRVLIQSENDILRARQTARDVAEDIGLSITDATRTVTATSELARNIHLYADEGEMRWQEIHDGTRRGIELVFDDDGPGIADVEGAVQAEFSTSDGMGRGIQGAKKLMDEFEIESNPDDGTTITIRKWS